MGLGQIRFCYMCGGARGARGLGVYKRLKNFVLCSFFYEEVFIVLLRWVCWLGLSVVVGNLVQIKLLSSPNDAIYVMDADGTNLRQLTEGADLMGMAGTIILRGHPTEKRLLSKGDADSPYLHVMDADGSNLRTGNVWSRELGRPIWSPDGEQIAFYKIDITDEDEYGEVLIFVIDADDGFTKVNKSCLTPL